MRPHVKINKCTKKIIINVFGLTLVYFFLLFILDKKNVKEEKSQLKRPPNTIHNGFWFKWSKIRFHQRFFVDLMNNWNLLAFCFSFFFLNAGNSWNQFLFPQLCCLALPALDVCSWMFYRYRFELYPLMFNDWLIQIDSSGKCWCCNCSIYSPINSKNFLLFCSSFSVFVSNNLKLRNKLQPKNRKRIGEKIYLFFC